MSAPQDFFDLLVGKPISHVWRGYGSALFLEFGALAARTRRDGSIGNDKGELTLMIEWSWRIERQASILGGSWSDERRWPKLFERLLGARVLSAGTSGRLPEIVVQLGNGLHVCSFMTAEGQPAWALMTRQPSIGSLHVRRGRLQIEAPKPGAAISPSAA